MLFALYYIDYSNIIKKSKCAAQVRFPQRAILPQHCRAVDFH